MIPLPIDPQLPRLVALLRQFPAAVLVASPGAGKTTRVPPALLDAGIAGDGRILMLQPRRVAARMSARRIAWERGSPLGEEVGYQVRFERMSGPRTRIEVLTEGLLTRRLQADPFLDGVSVVILDEFHERSQHADLCLALLREVQQEARPDLVLVVMSATLEPLPVAAFLGGAPVLEVEGRRFPVEIRQDPAPDDRPLPLRLAGAVRELFGETGEGHILCFLPGVGEIIRCQELLQGLEAEVLPLHGSLPAAEQDRALSPSARRKIVLATNIAETSVTLEGVVAVVDAGLARVPRFDPALGLERLETVPISLASAEQRAGRAGRTGPGIARRLWTENEQRLRPASDQPEIRRADLAGTCLELFAWGQHPRRFSWYEAPPEASLQRAEALLEQLGAVREGAITPLGRQLAALPLHPRLGRVVIEGQRRGCLRAAAGAAALASERDPWEQETQALSRGGRDDLLSRLEMLDLPQGTGASRRALQAVRAVRDQIARSVEGPAGHSREDDVLAALIAGFPDRVALRRAPGSERFLLASGAGAILDGDAGGADLLVAVVLSAGGRGRELRIRLAAPLPRSLLPIDERSQLGWDPEREAVVHRLQQRFGALILGDRPARGEPDPVAVAALLAEKASADPRRALGWDEDLDQLLGRIDFLRHHRPELDLPRPDPLALMPELCLGRKSLAELRALDLKAEILGRLSWPQRQQLDELAPERLGLPSGSTARLRYEAADRAPILAARIQQLFGLDQTPRVAGGRVPVLLHLLAPNHRPVQVTEDLPGFWRRGYPEVRKELRGRYPKHAWPEDPLSARPEDKPRRR